MTHYGMVVDLFKCIACNTCAVACKMQNGTPKGVLWRRINQGEVGSYPQTKRMFASLSCMQCQNTPCVKVCPTGATYKRADGIVVVNYDKCIGCRYCIAACPYDARSFMGTIQNYFPEMGITPLESIGYTKFTAGTVSKCTFCSDKIDTGVKAGLTPGVDRDATPACVNACPTGALVFGDLDDSNSTVSRTVSDNSPLQLLQELGTKPSVYFIPATRSAATKVEP
jgi:phenylacetyl-CoA:acceptor oxidoreductase 27-kDa subunit